MKMGHVTSDNQISAFIVRSGYFTTVTLHLMLLVTGLVGGTICKSPGSFQVK